VVFEVSSRYRDRAMPKPQDVDPPAATEAARTSATPGHSPAVFADAARRRAATAQLNPRFTFENFVVGGSNRFSFAACEAVSKKPGHVYNPLFIWGGTGLGKTHIMQAIGNALASHRPDACIRYVSTEKFMNEMIQSIQRGTTFDFRRTFRSADLLLIDDIQFLAGKESTQEEFFHTFNTLYDAHKQIVITSDRPPRELRDLEERLVSRFNWGLVSDIQSPDFETRVAILRRKAEVEKLEIADDVMLLLAERITKNVRELEGSLVRLSALASLTGKSIDRGLCAQFLRDLLEDQGNHDVDIPRVMKSVAKRFSVSVDAIKGKRRTNAIAKPRQVAMFLSKKLTGASLSEIGNHFERDHTTVLYACDKIEKLRTSDSDLQRLLDDLIGELRPSAGFPV
jgi:chromosomal replication initiator protein